MIKKCLTMVNIDEIYMEELKICCKYHLFGILCLSYMILDNKFRYFWKRNTDNVSNVW